MVGGHPGERGGIDNRVGELELFDIDQAVDAVGRARARVGDCKGRITGVIDRVVGVVAENTAVSLPAPPSITSLPAPPVSRSLLLSHSACLDAEPIDVLFACAGDRALSRRCGWVTACRISIEQDCRLMGPFQSKLRRPVDVVDREGLVESQTGVIGHPHRDRLRGGGLIIEQGTVGDRDLAVAGIDRK